MDKFELILGDCLKEMGKIPDKSIDMILCDLPYGTTACKWDVVLPFDLLWGHYNRVIKDNKAILLFGAEPFSTNLRVSNIENYKYDWYWDKKFGGNFPNAKKMPLKSIECISVFVGGGRIPDYYPQMVDRDKPIRQGGTGASDALSLKNNPKTHTKRVYDKKYPVTLLQYPKELGRTVHPTQKPVHLLEYLIRTYTLEGETVLDNCMGSGSTGVACLNTGRNFIGIEKDARYFELAKERIETHKVNLVK